MSLIIPGQTPKVKPTWQSYDDEFSYASDFDPKLAAEIKEYESREKHETTDSRTKEEYYRLFEGNVESRKQYRFAHQDEFKLHREGRILHMNKFLGMLKDTGVDAWYNTKGGMPKTLGLNVLHAGTYDACKHESGEPHYVCFVQVPFMQEYEEMHFDRYDVPLGSKRRGWRTVLLNLVMQGVLTEAQAHEVFGAPDNNIVSRRYREQMKFFRNKNI